MSTFSKSTQHPAHGTRTTGVASAMLVDCSSIMPFMSASCSVMRCSSLLRSLMASVRPAYTPWGGGGGEKSEKRVTGSGAE